MRVISFNANGIRAAARKGFYDWLAVQRADVVCIQETKAQQHQLEAEIFRPAGFHCYYEDASKKGYSGVAIYCRREPDKVVRGCGIDEFDAEGRYIEIELPGVSVVSVYMPSGSSSESRQEAKYRWMEAFMPHLRKLRRRRRHTIICGDWNIAHKKIDLKNWRSNQKNSGFLPEERAWMDEVFRDRFYLDAFREVNREADQYTWWSNRGRAWEKNVGWRIDYHVVTPSLKDRILGAEIYTEQRFSDHAPLILSYKID